MSKKVPAILYDELVSVWSDTPHLPILLSSTEGSARASSNGLCPGSDEWNVCSGRIDFRAAMAVRGAMVQASGVSSCGTSVHYEVIMRT